MTLTVTGKFNMASTTLLRCWTKGGRLLFSSKLIVNPNPGLMKTVVPCKGFKMTPCSSGALDYFRARRGPFTPEEKQGTGHLMFTSQHWKMERIVAVSMIGIMPSALFFQGPAMDFLLSTSVFLHGFWGFDHVLSDYVQKFIPFIHYVWYAVSILAFAGLMHFNYNDVGVTKAIAMLWRV